MGTLVRTGDWVWKAPPGETEGSSGGKARSWPFWLPAAFSEACSSVLLRNTLRGEVLELSDCPLES